MDNIESTQPTEPDASIEASPVTRKTWTEFRDTGLLTLLNTFLHIFGWAIVVQQNDDGSEIVYPARTIFRGFSEQSQSNAYKKIAQYMVTESHEILKEAEDA